MVKYNYDTWGKLISIEGDLKDSLGVKNPYRYKGYRYDIETGLYYLNSRYYNAEWGRFINADSAIGQIGNVKGHNMFQYCMNNPVMLDDPSGYWPKLSTILTVVAVAATVVAVGALIIATAGMSAPALVLAGVGGVTLGGSVAGALAVALAATTVAIAAVSIDGDAVEEAFSNNRGGEGKYTVYTLNDTTGTVRYVGRTKKYDDRMKAHLKDPKKINLEPGYKISGLTYSQSRGIEQVGMTYYHTRNFLGESGINLINGISPKKWNKTVYLKHAAAYLENQAENQVLSWTE